MARKFTLLLISLLFSLNGFSQSSQDLIAVGHWDSNSLPAIAGIAYNDIWGYADSAGREYAIVGTLEYTLFFDITVPSNPVPVDTVMGAYGGAIHRDLKTYQHYCYGVADEGTNSTLQIMDMSYLPDSVHVVYDTNAWFSRAHNIFIEEAAGRMYICGTRSLRNGIYVFDIATNPESPILIGNTDLGQYTHDLYVRNDTAWLNNGPNGLVVYDFTNPAAPVPIGALPVYPGQGYNHSSWLTESGDYLVMADETHNSPMRMLSASNLSNLTVVSTFKSTLLAPADTTSIPHNPFAFGNYAIVSYYHDGVQIFDISNPNAPVQRAWYDTDTVSTDYSGYSGCWGVYPFLPSGHIIASDVLSGLWILRPDFPFPTPRTSAVAGSDVSCQGGNNGSATVLAGGGTGPYDYLWSTGDTVASLSNLAAGTYYVTTTDRLGFSTQDSVVIDEPAELVSGSNVTGETCVGSMNGMVSLNTSGGTQPYAYLWSNGDTSAAATGLAAGTYTVTVTDANGCVTSASGTVSVLNTSPPASAGQDSMICAADYQLQGNDPGTGGSGSWQLLGGSGVFSDPGDSNCTLSGLAPGNNTLVWTVTSGSCASSDTVVINRVIPGVAYAGVDTIICGTTFQMTGLMPGMGSGMWSVMSGTGSFGNASNATSQVSGLTPGVNEFVWTVTNSICEDRDTVSVEVIEPVSASFTYTQTGNNFTFSNQSNNASTYFWDFGDNSTLIIANPTHAYLIPGNYTVCLIATNVCGSDTSCQPVSILVGTEDFAMENWTMYPNPAVAQIRVEGQNPASGTVTWELLDVTGKVVWTQPEEVFAGQFGKQIDLSGIARGVYVLRRSDLIRPIGRVIKN